MDTSLYIVRFVHYAAALQLFGTTVFQAWMAPRLLREALQGPSQVVTKASVWLLLVSSVLWLALMAGSMGDGWPDTINPAVLGTVLTATQFGHVWSWRLVLAVLLVVAATAPSSGRRWSVVAVLATLALGSLGRIGHATMDIGVTGVLHQSSQILHLLGSGFWVGSLLPLVFCLKALASPVLGADADVALRRFSGLGHVAVAVALGTGVANSWFILRAVELDPTIPYQSLLLAKVALVGAMVGLALINRYIFVPRIPNNGPGARQLRDGTIAEIVLGVGVVALVGVLGALPPS